MAGNVRSVKCPACGAPFTVRGMGQTTTAACQACGSILDISNQELVKIIEQFSITVLNPVLPLGLRFTIEETKYEIIGCLNKSDATSTYYWEEYLLFHPYKGFAWLVQSDGHWSFLKMVKDVDGLFGDNSLRYEDEYFRRFLRDEPIVQSVVGEFYWEVRRGDQAITYDYIAPPYLLSAESADNECAWSYGYYIEPRDLPDEIKAIRRLPRRRGIGMNQPNPWKRRAGITTTMGVFFCLLAQILHSLVKPDDQGVIFNDYQVLASSVTGTLNTKEFQVTGQTTNLSIQVDAPVDNNWVDLDMTLYDQTRNERDGAELEVAFYHGSDSDGAWHEGSKSAQSYIAGVEPGRYSLAITPALGTGLTEVPVDITVSAGEGFRGNLILCIIALALVPLGCLIGVSMFEKKRQELAESE